MSDASSFTTSMFQDWVRLWSPKAMSLSQPINPGWSFGNVVVNEQNSSDPKAEQQIVAAESYGRQLGKLLEAVCALIEARGADADPAFRDVLELKAKVDRIKREAAVSRIEQLRQDLELLKRTDADAFQRQVIAFATLLGAEPQLDAAPAAVVEP